MRALNGLIFCTTFLVATSAASAQKKRPLGSTFAKQRQGGGNGGEQSRSSTTTGNAPRPNGASGEIGTTRPSKQGTTHLTASGKPLTQAERKAIQQRSLVEEKQRAKETSRQKATAAKNAVSEAEARVTSASRAMTGAQQRLGRAVREVEELQGKIGAAEKRLKAARREANDAVRRTNVVGKKKGFVSQVIGALTFGLVVDRKVDERLQDEALELLAEVDELERSIPTLRRRFDQAQGDLTAANVEVESAQAADDEARRQLQPLIDSARRMTQEASQAEVALEQATTDLTAAEQEAERAVAKYMQKRALQDQHRLRLASEEDRTALKSGFTRYRQAAKRFKLISLIEPKPGEYSQDAVAAVPEEGVFAISDGVSQSEFPGEFARSLVRVYTARKPSTADEFSQVLEEAQREWDGETRERIAAARGNWYARDTKWVADATFLGARLEGTGKRQRLKLIGLGDSNLFVVRDGAIVKAWPLERAEQFGKTTKALKSTAAPRGKVPTASVPVQPGDEVFMTTDALSAWILKEVEAGRDPFPLLREIKTQKQLNDFAEKARDQLIPGRAQMTEDDTTLLRFVIP
jgi:predicted  nucleic acid-binding Zn-ribbon protein